MRFPDRGDNGLSSRDGGYAAWNDPGGGFAERVDLAAESRREILMFAERASAELNGRGRHAVGMSGVH